MTISFFVHPNGIVEDGAHIGDGTRIWAFVHILPGAQIGADCNICDQVFIENNVKMGDRVTIKSGVHLWDGILLEDDVFIGPNVAFTNDLFPRSKHQPQVYSRTTIRHGASIGSNATILAGITIGQYAMIGAGSVVTRDVPVNAVVVGNPGRVVGFVNGQRNERLNPVNALTESVLPQISKVKIIHLNNLQEDRGRLSFGEVENHLPFIPRRYFVISHVPLHEVRGHHAHRQQHQFLTCVSGLCHVVVDDGVERAEVVLSSPQVGMHIPPMIWGLQYKYSSDAVLLAFASGNYDQTDYINSYEDFLVQATKNKYE
jgi:acetyltransferase-like isoleucine patch superfamily enzyme/dTDP-4-dehydrorhamnose 3,5-epimerase-like enzyme